MLLYILRHAEAEAVVSSDAARKLTSRGQEQATRVGLFCKNNNIKPPLILTSPVCRALETAQLVLKNIEEASLLELPWIACGMSPGTALHELQAYASFDSVMIVGHEPDLSSLMAMLLGVRATALNVSKASLSAIEVKRLASGTGVLRFFIPCKLAQGK